MIRSNMFSFKLNKIIHSIEKLHFVKKTPDEEYKIQLKKEILHEKLSEILFKAIKNEKYRTVDIIIRNDFLDKKLLVSSEGYNIVQHSIFNNNVKLFKVLFYKYYEDVKEYFFDIPQLFLNIVNKKNYNLMSIFLKDEKLYSFLTKENISLLLYSLIKDGKDNILETIIKYNYINENIDGRTIQSILVFLVSHGKIKEFVKIVSNEKLFIKCEDEHLINLVALALLNKNLNILEYMVENDKFLNIIFNNEVILKNILVFSQTNKNIKILSCILKNKEKIEIKKEKKHEKSLTKDNSYENNNSEEGIKNSISLFEDSL